MGKLLFFIITLHLATGVCVSCALNPPPKKEIEVDFTAEVKQANACAVANDCVLVYPGCPLGCGVAVNATMVADIQQLAKDLITEYEEGNPACEYDCAIGETDCQQGVCVAIFE